MRYIVLITIFFGCYGLFGQMTDNGVTKYGNEWIKDGQVYYKVLVWEDGDYKVDYQLLQSVGLNNVNGSHLQVFHQGEEIPIHTSTEGLWTDSDFFTFRATKNKAFLDKYMFPKGLEDMTNPKASLYTDTAAYFITVNPTGTHLRTQIVHNDLSNPPAAETELVGLFEFGYNGRTANNQARIGETFFNHSEFTAGKGMIHTTQNAPLAFNLEGLIASENKTRYNLRGVTNYGISQLNHDIKVSINNHQVTEVKTNFQQNYFFNFNGVDEENILIAFGNNLTFTPSYDNDHLYMGYVSFEYPRSPQLTKLKTDFIVQGNSEPRYIKFKAIAAALPIANPILTDEKGQWQIHGEVVGDEIHFVIPAFSDRRQMTIITNTTNRFVTTANISAQTLYTFEDSQADYIIISARHLMSAVSGTSAVQEYADYRASQAGGGYRVQVININDLYNSFAYGTHFHPMSIKNFSNYIHTKGKARFLFLIGRGADYITTRTHSQKQAAINAGFCIPSYGDIGADNLLVSKSFDRLDMLLAIGRLPARTQTEVRTYLSKIKSSDAAYKEDLDTELKAWTKKVLQLNGGDITKSDFNQIRNNHNTNKSVALKSKMSADVSYYAKNSSQTIETPIDLFFKEINIGAAIVDYFGHGSNNALAYEIHFPDKFNNSQRMPILMLRGCSTGNSNLNINTRSDEVLYGANYGANGFRAVLGSITYSLVGPLSTIGTEFYNQLMNTNYGATLGEITKSVLSKPGIMVYDEAIQMQLNGDPAIAIEPLKGPDYTILPMDASISPEIITENETAVTLEFTVTNHGINLGDTLEYRVIYMNPKGDTIETIDHKIFPADNKVHVQMEIALDKTAALGDHIINILLDPNNKIKEEKAPAAELNNEFVSSTGQKGLRFFVQAAGIHQVYPQRYAIVPNDTITLMTYTTELQNKPYTYSLAIDTTKKFNSPILIQHQITTKPGHFEWHPNFRLQENTVYYWRVSRDSLNPNELAQSSISSFTFINGISGFQQAHNGQWEENINVRVKTEGDGNNLIFGTRPFPLLFKNGLVTAQNRNALGGFRDGRKSVGFATQNQTYDLYPEGAFGLAIFRRDSFLLDFQPGDFPFGSSYLAYASGRNNLVYEPLKQESRLALIDAIENGAHPDDIILFYTCIRADQANIAEQEWAADSIVNDGKNIFNIIEKYGGTKLRTMLQTGPKPYTIIFDKKLGLLAEHIADSNEIFDTEANILCKSDDGFTRQIVGPAKKWNKFEISRKDSLQLPDRLTANVIFYHKNDVTKNIEYSYTIDKYTKHFERDYSQTDLSDYPLMSYEVYALDELSYRGKLDGYNYIRVYADELPEATLLNDDVLTFKSDTLDQGENLVFRISSKNISHLKMDSMLVKFSIISDQTSYQDTTRFNVLLSGEKDIYTFQLPIINMTGNCLFTCEMNPNNDQIELFHNNNLYYKRFYVRGDQENPLIDVTFDGEHIFDGDIINWQPLIKVTIKDENQFQALNDSTLFDIDIFAGNDFSPIYTRYSPEVVFYPAVLDGNNKRNEAYFEIRPQFDSSGYYSIKVKARDVAGNSSGSQPYTKKFQVINEKSVSNLFNYPNPFSNATRFVYTLTGNELPTYYKIQIMSVSGKVVREITQDELGPLKIGKHMTDYVWNGTDQFGDKLANGVYLYRFVIKDQDRKKYDKYEIKSTDRFFTGEWGKMVIIR